MYFEFIASLILSSICQKYVEVQYVKKRRIVSILSLYSTATQNYWRWVLLGHLTQKIVLLHHLTQGYQHVGIFCRRKFLASAMYISFFVCRFHLRWVANANPISSGI